jgi:hypothetical protein
VRFVVTLFLWLLTTVALAVAVPSAWAQKTVIDPDGYVAFAASAAKDPLLQQAMAAELSTQVTSLAADNGYHLNPDLVHDVAAAYTGNSGFPGQFAQANRIAHRWMFTDSTQQGDSVDQWLIDIAPMLSDQSFEATLGTLDLEVPETLTVPITVPSAELHPGRLRQLSTWGPWVSIGAAILTGMFALLTVATARSRGKALAALGVSALLVGAVGWAGIEVARRDINGALNRTTGDIRQIADVMVNQAEGSLHHWLNLTLAAGAVLVVLGIVVSMLAGLRRRD